MRSSLGFMVCCALVVTASLQACAGGAETDGKATSPPASSDAETPPPSTGDTTDIDPASAYLRRCGGCHGAEGTAQGAQTLEGVGSRPESFVLDKVMTGGRGMPAFGEWLDQAEIDAIVTYVRATF